MYIYIIYTYKSILEIVMVNHTVTFTMKLAIWGTEKS